MNDEKSMAAVAKRTLIRGALLAGVLALCVNAGVSLAAGASVLSAVFRASVAFACVAGLGVVVLPKLSGVLLSERNGTEAPSRTDQQRPENAETDRIES